MFPGVVSDWICNVPRQQTLCRYFNNRILNADGRFAQNVDYIFFAQYMSEVEKVVSSVSIALRKGKGGQFKNVTTSVLNDEEQFKQLLQFDDGYRFLKPIRGTPDNDDKFHKMIYVKFDDHQVGTKRRSCCAFTSAVETGSTGIEPEEERVTKHGGLRRQFPLKLYPIKSKDLLWIKKIFAAGQAYVALSRVRSLSGLVIQNFDEKAIYCKDNIEDAIATMPPFLVTNITACNFTTPPFNVFLMNVQNLTPHVTDLALCTQHLQLNCIAVTETWLPAVYSLETVKMDGYAFHNHPRSLPYNSSNPLFKQIRDQQHGGVGMYSAENLAYSIIPVPNVHLECLVYHCLHYNILIAVIYRPPSYTITLFKENLETLLNWLNHQSTTIAVMGDFNDNILKSSTIYKFMTDKGFIQIVKQATTEKGTLIDHVYVKTSHYDVQSVVLPTYFSDHEGILCSFTSRSLEHDHGKLE
ncbi:LOW QUALITY PROTEIN: uncharacterized protein LOC127372410 [Dicentrarchus labrax]|uniref:LOW QUALITY PROTEIN: uncharacterized protein LOC127372410 n=1 Tax=Dicentrarchus labrax TaxID=13489 RepID=UPI0021F53946|nr:LOW QUALITY PROTEIN: uncharacterized protein LOC127372410 [Dicentrarchus labrax]